MKIKIDFLIFVLLIVCIDINGQTKFESIRLDSLLTLLTDNNRFMGSVTISKNGNAIYDKAFGYCDVSSKKQAVVNSKYRIGSITKMFTSVMIFQLIEEKN